MSKSYALVPEHDPQVGYGVTNTAKIEIPIAKVVKTTRQTVNSLVLTLLPFRLRTRAQLFAVAISIILSYFSVSI